MTLIDKFIEKILEIKALKPKYRQPCDGSNGYCDCVGLIIGALRRAKIQWSGIHGSNWFARKDTINLKPLKDPSQLSIGDLVYQAYEPGEKGYALPARYKKGGAYYNGSLTDYMHIGVVTAVNPLGITHMWKPTVQTDSSIKYWDYFGQYKKFKGLKATDPANRKTAIVTAANGKPVKMRQNPSTACRTYELLPVGTQVTIEVPGEVWAQISYGKFKGWYMMAKFLKINER